MIATPQNCAPVQETRPLDRLPGLILNLHYMGMGILCHCSAILCHYTAVLYHYTALLYHYTAVLCHYTAYCVMKGAGAVAP